MTVPSSAANSALIGRGGEVVNRLKRESGCFYASSARGSLTWTIKANSSASIQRFIELAAAVVLGCVGESNSAGAPHVVDLSSGAIVSDWLSHGFGSVQPPEWLDTLPITYRSTTRRRRRLVATVQMLGLVECRVKIMSYNILEGGNLSRGDRTDLLLELIRGSSPDVVGLNECRGFAEDDHARLRLFERELGMIGVMNEAQSGNHVALLYGPDIKVVETSQRTISMYNGYARVTMETSALGQVAIVATHLHPFSSTFRVGEMEILAARAASAPAAIIMGDMNSIAPSDADVDLTDAPRTMSERLRGPSGDIDTDAVSVLLRRGYLDLGQPKAQATYPTMLSRERSEPRVRLDYMFVSPAIAERCIEFQVRKDDKAQRASDHLPIVAEIDLA
jgi:exodeoxyribonuclease III